MLRNLFNTLQINDQNEKTEQESKRDKVKSFFHVFLITFKIGFSMDSSTAHGNSFKNMKKRTISIQSIRNTYIKPQTTNR